MTSDATAGAQVDSLDPKGLIRESFCIDGIQNGECRSIFLDWALSLPDGVDSRQAMSALLAEVAADHPDHPMTAVLREGLESAAKPRRRGGWRSRAR
ncbi:hypothetical protein [Phaeobacter gallaeciensis]|uniref:Uncharacterized protein n=1 Tax=Phaeobacter gallaeciensis TaxID=60890 RepID=A0AAC9Z7Z3_9RHOB|nr:hypothetical protein [Phaeobacter gallaeciensis]AHD09192.1 hypothetical protein Gal_01430 [Phaeobacter gallaeciensis DSM 26640]ATE92455.1 hypothetical protein PhaeoP11_01421 [Phaeobacter gallaeciensis]ATE97723.1 hypothetical protein PhaeoP73_02425 [Phaeobacter gallaeciensis]ATF01120.1 hypothetical protein PhaeoP75_01471 [Phaeobacter gallaeciensis]ATF05500.1 hypothetical protein PhaeoP63_01419 [Phaeobacter gallaeciensis]